jgi:hypothetical protein
MIQRFHIMTRVSSEPELEMINNYSKPTIGWNPQRTGYDNRCISRRKGCPRSALFEVLDEGDDKRALREQCSRHPRYDRCCRSSEGELEIGFRN